MDNIELPLSGLLGSATGGGAVVFFAKLYLQRAFKELDTVVAAMNKVQKELAAITSQLRTVDENNHKIHEHDTRLALLEKQVFKGKN